MRGLGAGYSDFEIALSGGFAGVAGLIGHVVRVVVSLRIGHVLLRIRHRLLGVGLRVCHIALCFSLRVGYIVLNLGGRLGLVAARQRQAGRGENQINICSSSCAVPSSESVTK